MSTECWWAGSIPISHESNGRASTILWRALFVTACCATIVFLVTWEFDATVALPGIVCVDTASIERNPGVRSVASVRGGRVVQVAASLGSYVQIGEKLLTFETEADIAELERCRQRMAESQIQLGVLEAGLAQELSAALIERQIASLEKERVMHETSENVQRHQSDLEIANSQLSLARDAVTRYEAIAERGVTIPAEDRLRRLVECDIATIKARFAKVKPFLAGVAIIALRAELQAAERQVQILRAKNQISDVKDRLLTLKTLEQNTQLRSEEAVISAPGSGTIVSIDVHVGDVIERGACGIRILPDQPFVFEGSVSEMDADAIQNGASSHVAVTAIDGFRKRSLQGQVLRIASFADATRVVGSRPITSFRVTVAFEPSQDDTQLLKPGMTGIAYVVVGRMSCASWTLDEIWRMARQ